MEHRESDAEYRARRARREEMLRRRKIEKQRQMRRMKRIRAAIMFGVPALVLIALVVIISVAVSKKVHARNEASSQEIIVSETIVSEISSEYLTEYTSDGAGRPHPDAAYIKSKIDKEHPFRNINPIVDGMIQVGDVKMKAGYTAETTSSTIFPSEEYATSLYSILIDASTGEIVASRDAKTRMYPASMTKIMTLLVAVENIKTLDDVVYVSKEAADWSYSNDGSAVNWSVGEKLTVKDLLYGTILSSGADASYDLAVYVARSPEAFVDLMNAKCEELGIAGTTHFTNCAGFYNDDHYTTAYDMAMIIKAAVENDLCREVMSAHTYTTPNTVEHPEGILISNWFLRRIEDKDSRGLVLCAKTGFVNQSGNCAASYMGSNSGRPYICVTGHAHSAWRAIYDHVGLYYNYTK